MSFLPGLGIARGMGLTLRRFFAPKATIQYPETAPDIAVRFRGRLQLLYDEWGNLKCETCFQCAQACPVECIDMGGFDTLGRFHVHWGEAETYGERREESALRRSGRPVPDPTFTRFAAVDVAAVDRIADRFEYDPRKTLQILEAIQDEYGHLPVAALKRYSQISGATSGCRTAGPWSGSASVPRAPSQEPAGSPGPWPASSPRRSAASRRPAAWHSNTLPATRPGRPRRWSSSAANRSR
jgi:ferredoxin